MNENQNVKHQIYELLRASWSQRPTPLRPDNQTCPIGRIDIPRTTKQWSTNKWSGMATNTIRRQEPSNDSTHLYTPRHISDMI
jgi:hypothetical protein